MTFQSRHPVPVRLIVLCLFAASLLSGCGNKTDTADAKGGEPKGSDTVQEADASDVSTPITYYCQGDPQWANYLYGGRDPLAGYGCGPTALAITVSSLNGTAITPVDAAKWAEQNGCFSAGHGSAHKIIPSGAAAYGLKAEKLSVVTPDAIRTTLSYHKLLVLLMGPGDFSDAGHFIIAYGYRADGSILVADPASPDRSAQSWSADLLISQLHTATDDGAPAWVISK